MPLQSQFRGQKFENWLEELGNGSLNDECDYVITPQALRCSTHDIGDLINFAYPSIHVTQSDDYFRQRCILAPHEREVHEINEIASKQFPGPVREAWSAEEAIDARTKLPNHDFPIEFLRSITHSDFPLGELSPKVGCPVVFLRNIGHIPAGRRGIITKIDTFDLKVRMLSGEDVFCPEIRAGIYRQESVH